MTQATDNPGFYSGFRVAVVGSCQVGGIASALNQLLPGAQVKAWHYGVTPGTAEEIAATITDYDLVISQLLGDMGEECLEPHRLQQICRSLVVLPIFGFPGLHPDCVFVYQDDGKFVETPLGPYNSSIAFASFRIGLSEKRTEALFNSYIYSRLGYFDAFSSSKNAIVTAFQQAGYDISCHIDRWRQQVGCFMYTPNHPRGEVMWDMAILALSKAGLDFAVPSDAVMDQYLSLNAVWPVYPEIARRLGTVDGGLDFTAAGLEGPLSNSRRVDLSLFIAESFKVYAEYDPGALRISGRDVMETIRSEIS